MTVQNTTTPRGAMRDCGARARTKRSCPHSGRRRGTSAMCCRTAIHKDCVPCAPLRKCIRMFIFARRHVCLGSCADATPCQKNMCTHTQLNGCCWPLQFPTLPCTIRIKPTSRTLPMGNLCLSLCLEVWDVAQMMAPLRAMATISKALLHESFIGVRAVKERVAA